VHLCSALFRILQVVAVSFLYYLYLQRGLEQHGEMCHRYLYSRMNSVVVSKIIHKGGNFIMEIL